MALSGIIPALIVLIGMSLPAPVVHPKIARIRALIMLTCSLIFFWSMISALHQAEPLVEVGYAVMWFTMVIACWWAAPRIMANADILNVLRNAGVPIFIGIVLSLIFLLLNPSYDIATGRFSGIFYTSPAMDEAAFIGALIAIILYKHGAKNPALYALIIIIAYSCAVLTRSRGAFALLFVLSVIAFVLGRGIIARTLAIAFAISLLAIISMLNMNQAQINKVKDFTRIQSSVYEDAFSRSNAYIDGVYSILWQPIFGNGFVSRYSSSGSDLNNRIRGNHTLDTYSFDDDPHLMIITLGKSIGIPGIILGCLIYILLIALLLAYINRCNTFNGYAIILCIIMLLLCTLTSNTLLSFGAIGDRYYLLIISILSVCSFGANKCMNIACN